MMNTYTLKNNYLTAVLKTQGAELISLKNNETEYIWQGDSKYWNRHTPVLFPFVGGLKDGFYKYENNSYSLGQHGFARDQDFEMIDKTENSITFELTPNDYSKKVYPFDFVFHIKYTLNNTGLVTAYMVKNTQKENIYFSVGGHPAFNCPFEKNHTREEYILMFDNNETPKSSLIKQGLISDEKFDVFKEQGVLELIKNIFDNDAIIFDPNPFSEVSFIHEPTGNTYMSVSFKNFPYLGIWSKNQEAPFVCIEPWHGIADLANHNNELTKKEGIIKLIPNDSFNCEYSINVNINND